MKKIFLAVCAVAAMASCVKNEPEIQRLQSDSRITFSPLVSTVTKANTTEITGTTFPNTEGFSVYGWYSTDATFAGNGTLYMNDVAVSYDSTIQSPETSQQGTGAWAPTNDYFWPKNGKLTFDAYYPSTVSVASDVKTGLSVTDYVVANNNATQVDLLMSERVHDKVASTQGNKDYDGVDIKFNHALAVVHIMVKAANKDAADAIEVTSVTLKDIKNVGTYKQNYAYTGGTGVASPAWTVSATASAVAYDANPGQTATKIAQTEAKYGNSMIVLPQSFTTDAADAVLEVKYTIQNGGTSGTKTPQVMTFKLADAKDNTTTAVNSWEMGKRYIYHLTFGLDKIYFAPSVNDWTEVNANFPEIK